jgi:hypothetical protein
MLDWSSTTDQSRNTDAGLWLHHFVMVDLDMARRDVSCPTYANGYRFFASGNERTLIELTLDWYVLPTRTVCPCLRFPRRASKTGFPLFQSPQIAYIFQLMNERPAEQELVLTMDIEYYRR